MISTVRNPSPRDIDSKIIMGIINIMIRQSVMNINMRKKLSLITCATPARRQRLIDVPEPIRVREQNLRVVSNI